ncbi:uncharacterized protein LOC106095156 [Stomoxys calcitrans]|uniref:MD-2-related lipid-recognition domain-containing protein n=1 Tax=Stomoxys calcitrans TaxID=35570 RepID=A0A1I8Q943_STOCA|nr:uncharacterized protein LOC106095156 [Stomoxys calcitrans]
MSHNTEWLFVVLVVVQANWAIKIKFTNLQCDEYDKPFANFEKCRLKAIDRHRVALNVTVALHQIPVNNVSLNVQLLKKGNGYRPFMYNNTMDFCQFLKTPSRYMFWKIVFLRMVRPASNINHTCPFDHNIIVQNLILDSSMLDLIPFPADDYMMRFKVGAYNHYKAEVRAFIQIYN